MTVADRTTQRVPLSRRKRLFFPLLVVIFVYGILEIVSAAVLWVEGGRVESPVVSRYGPIAGGPQGNPLPNHLAVLSLHPYLGYVYDRDSNAGFSDHGFTSETVYPQMDDALIVGIFGGSVADQLFVKRQTLENELEKIPELGQKAILFVNLAIGGFKQPQQLMALTYMLSLGGHFDVVINVDGFNEVTLPVNENLPNHVFPFFPR